MLADECDRKAPINVSSYEFGLCALLCEDVYRVAYMQDCRVGNGCVVETAVRMKARAGMLMMMMIRWCWYGVVLWWY